MFAVVLFFLSITAVAFAKDDACSEASSISDVQFTIALNDHEAVFRYGEIIPLRLSFTSNTKNRYWAYVRNYDRSGRLGIEQYCVEGNASDPLQTFFKFGGFLGGGLGSTHALDATPFRADAELNEWWTLEPGRHRVFAISYRIWRPRDPGEKTPYGRISEVVRSNSIEIDVNPHDPDWQREHLREVLRTLGSKSSPEEEHRAARNLRFLNTRDSTKQLARLWASGEHQSLGGDFMFGLYGSPYRQLAIDSMRAELRVPEAAITSEFMGMLVNLQISSDPTSELLTTGFGGTEDASIWERRQAQSREVMKAEIRKVLAALPRKSGKARAVTLNGVLTAGGEDPMLVQTIRPALIAAWAELPVETQQRLIQYRWPLIAGPEMLPVLRRILAEPAPPARTDRSMARDAALKHLYELDSTAGRQAILNDLRSVQAEPGLDVIKLLPREDIPMEIPGTVERIAHHTARDLDYELVDRYADLGSLSLVQAAFEEYVSKGACAPQFAMLRYFLRIAPDYGRKAVRVALSARSGTGCYRFLFQELGNHLSKVEQIAIDTLDDSDSGVVESSVRALARWGSADAEKALWKRLERFHQDWAGREDQLISTPDYQSRGSRGIALEQALVAGLAKGVPWICPPEKLARLSQLSVSTSQELQIEDWKKQWMQGVALISSNWFPEESPSFSLLQYDGLTEDELRAKVAQLPRSMKLRWQFWQPGQISPPVSIEKQEQTYERLRAVMEQHGTVLGKENHH